MVSRIRSSNPKHSRDREFTVILEDLRSQFRVFGEGMTGLQKDMTAVKSRLTVLKGDMKEVMFRLSRVEARLGGVEGRLDTLEGKASFIMDKVLPTVATKDDLLALERRLVAIEHR